MYYNSMEVFINVSRSHKWFWSCIEFWLIMHPLTKWFILFCICCNAGEALLNDVCLDHVTSKSCIVLLRSFLKHCGIARCCCWFLCWWQNYMRSKYHKSRTSKWTYLEFLGYLTADKWVTECNSERHCLPLLSKWCWCLYVILYVHPGMVRFCFGDSQGNIIIL